MDNSFKFRNLQKNDIRDVLKIYNYYITNGLSNFEEKPITYQNFYKLYENNLKNNLPFIICLKNKKIIGFSYLSKFRNKSGYRFSFENSVYVHLDYLSLGLGSQLLKELIKSSLKNKNIKTIIAVISNSSMASIKTHKKNGFKMVGTLKNVGFKNNQWLDVIYMQKILS